MKKKLICIMIINCFFLFIGCGYQKEPRYVRLSDDIINRTAKELKIEKGLHLIGRGGALMYDVKKLSISFHIEEDINIKEGRDLLLYCIKKFLSNINSDEKVRPYLHSYPFQVKDVDLSISFKAREPTRKHPIDFISIHYGNIRYAISDKEVILKTVHKETYEEALKIVKGEISSKET